MYGVDEDGQPGQIQTENNEQFSKTNKGKGAQIFFSFFYEHIFVY